MIKPCIFAALKNINAAAACTGIIVVKRSVLVVYSSMVFIDQNRICGLKVEYYQLSLFYSEVKVTGINKTILDRIAVNIDRSIISICGRINKELRSVKYRCYTCSICSKFIRFGLHLCDYRINYSLYIIRLSNHPCKLILLIVFLNPAFKTGLRISRSIIRSVSVKNRAVLTSCTSEIILAVAFGFKIIKRIVSICTACIIVIFDIILVVYIITNVSMSAKQA